MNELKNLQKAVEREYDSRHLKSRTRYTALRNVIAFIEDYYHGNVSSLELDKKVFKETFIKNTGYTNSAAMSAINELYNQYHLLKNKE